MSKINLNILKSKIVNLINEDLGVWFGTKKKPKGSKQPKGPWVNICKKRDPLLRVSIYVKSFNWFRLNFFFFTSGNINFAI